MAHIVMAYVVMAYILMAYVFMAYIVMAYIVMAYVVTVRIVMAYIVSAYVAIAQSPAVCVGLHLRCAGQHYLETSTIMIATTSDQHCSGQHLLGQTKFWLTFPRISTIFDAGRTMSQALLKNPFRILTAKSPLASCSEICNN